MVALLNKLAHQRLHNGSLIRRASVVHLQELLAAHGAGRCGGDQQTNHHNHRLHRVHAITLLSRNHLLITYHGAQSIVKAALAAQPYLLRNQQDHQDIGLKAQDSL